MTLTFPLRVLTLDDDPIALALIEALLARDPRFTSCGAVEEPDQLLPAASEMAPDIVVLDAEYSPLRASPRTLMAELRRRLPDVVIVVLAQYADRGTLREAVTAGARGYLLKREVRLAVAAALVRACRARFVISPGVEAVVDAQLAPWLAQAERLAPWQPHPRLTARQQQVLMLRAVFGLRAPLAAEEISRTPDLVEKTFKAARQVLWDGWVDDSFVDDLAGMAIKPEDDAFLRFTALPRRRHRAAANRRAAADEGRYTVSQPV